MNEEQLIVDNIPLIHFTIKNMNLRSKNEDVYQDWYDDGLLGLIIGVRTFDESKGIQLATYACECIRREILKGNKLRNYDKRKINYITKVSLNSLAKPGAPADDTCEILDFISDPTVNIEEEVSNRIECERLIFAIDTRLSERDAEIWKRYYGLDGRKITSGAKLGEKYGISRERVHQIVSNRNRRKIEYFLKKFQCYEWNRKNEVKKYGNI